LEPMPNKISLAGLYLRHIGANLFGNFTVVVLNLFTPLVLLEVQKALLFPKGGWRVLVFFLPFVVFIAASLQYLIQHPISKVIDLSYSGMKIQEDLKEKAQRRLLNLPFLLGFTSLVMWITVPFFVVASFVLFMNVPAKTSFFLGFRATMIGMIALTISFFLVEDYSRKKLIPWFFPKGRLSALRGTIKISIRRRIRVLYMAGTSVPMILLVGTLFFVLWELEDTPISAIEFGREILIFAVILCGIFIITALRLNFLVGKSILNPLGEMLGIVGKVRDGDFTQRIQVLSNDEIGVLSDAGNAMIAGLLEREKIRDTFGKYVTPEIRDHILAGRIPLNGERTQATLLFSDLRDFTTYVEKNDPEEVIQSMRAYFTAMQNAVRKHQGLVLQYVGDEVEAVFGVPVAYEGHVDNAVLAALEMRKSLEELNRVRAKEGKEPFRHGIGIHTGEVLAGNTGSEDRLSYTLIGDTVNLASRIQELTKEFQCDILVSEEAVKMLENGFDMKKESPSMVKGYSTPITVFQVFT
jgi:adenylate cyclase